MSTWKLFIEDDEQGTFAALGLSNLCRERVSMSNDVVTFDAPGADVDAAAILDYGDDVIIKKDAATWFRGRCVTNPRYGQPQGERQAYQLVGPWWYLEKIVYQQYWMTWDPAKEGGAGLDLLYKSRVILNQDEEDNAVTVAAQLADIIDFAIEKGAPITKGSISCSATLPMDEVVDITCAEAIVKLLRLFPDQVCWFDYSTANPTFNCVPRASVSAVSKAITDLSDLTIVAREDLQVPGVILRFETTTEIDGVPYESVTNQTAGDTADFDTVVSTIPLAGGRATTLTEAIVVDAGPSPATDKDWWQANDSYLALLAQADFDIIATNKNATLSSILTSGVIRPWMTGVSSETGAWEITVRIRVKDGGGNVIHQFQENRAIRLTFTNATSKTYRKIQSIDLPETPPAGMAAALYASWSQLHYDGSCLLTESEVGGTLYPGVSINITGGLAAWASMAALVQKVEENVDTGETSITFGPPRQIEPEGLYALLRGFRTRASAGDKVARETGETEDAAGRGGAGGGKIQLGGGAPPHDVAAAAGEVEKVVVRQVGETYTQKISNDPALISKTDANIDIKPREVLILETDASAFRLRQVMASAVYGDSTSITSITVVTDLKYDTSTHQLQVKTRTVKAISAGSESGWTLITGGQAAECDA